MNLLEQCQVITSSDPKGKEQALALGASFLESGFEENSSEVRKYHFPLKDRKVYLYIWNFQNSSQLHASMCPYREEFSFTCQFTPGQTTHLHVQDFVELAYVAKGELKQRILDKDIIFKEGDLCLIDKNCAHRDYLVDDHSVIIFLCMRNDVLPEIMEENITTHKITTFLQLALLKQKEVQQYVHFRPMENAKEEMDYCFSLIARELYEDHTGASFIVKGLLMRIFRLLSTHYEFHLSKQQKKDMNLAVFTEVCHYIEEHYKTVTIQELSKAFHFQEDYFNRLIKKKLGKTYCELLQEIRLFKAEQFLTHSNMTISEISERVGYRNKGYFYKLFTEKYGMTPAEYRKQL